MIALVVKGAVRDDDVGWMMTVTLRFLPRLLLRPDHDEWKLACWLPYFVLFGDLLGVQGYIFVPLMVPRLRTVFGIVNLVLCVVSARIRGRYLLFSFVNHTSPSQNVEPSLSFSDQLSILMLLKTNVLLLDMFLIGLVLIDRFRVDVVESFGAEQFWNVFFWFFGYVHLGASVELSSIWLLGSLPLVCYRVVDVGQLLLAIVVNCFRLFVARHHADRDLALVSDIVVGR